MNCTGGNSAQWTGYRGRFNSPDRVRFRRARRIRPERGNHEFRSPGRFRVVPAHVEGCHALPGG
jgi:hypothetical protein